MLSSNVRLDRRSISIINLTSDVVIQAACNKCGDQELRDSRNSLTDESAKLKVQIRTALPRIPVVSLQQPSGWSYDPITIVTAQTVTGTGIFSDVTSAFTDLFGTQSGSYNAKLREGENLCKEQLRSQAIELGGNAIIGVDVDYAEVGGQRAMLMVCMTGTAIRITKLQTPDTSFFEEAEGAHVKALRLRAIEKALSSTTY